MAEKMPPALGVGALPFRWEINSGRDKVRNGSVETGESGCKTMFVFSRQVLILLDFINTQCLPRKQPQLKQSVCPPVNTREIPCDSDCGHGRLSWWHCVSPPSTCNRKVKQLSRATFYKHTRLTFFLFVICRWRVLKWTRNQIMESRVRGPSGVPQSQFENRWPQCAHFPQK